MLQLLEDFKTFFYWNWHFWWENRLNSFVLFILHIWLCNMGICPFSELLQEKCAFKPSLNSRISHVLWTSELVLWLDVSQIRSPMKHLCGSSVTPVCPVVPEHRCSHDTAHAHRRGRSPSAAQLQRHTGSHTGKKRRPPSGALVRPSQQATAFVPAGQLRGRQHSRPQGAPHHLAPKQQLHHHQEGATRWWGLLQLLFWCVSCGNADCQDVRPRDWLVWLIVIILSLKLSISAVMFSSAVSFCCFCCAATFWTFHSARHFFLVCFSNLM